MAKHGCYFFMTMVVLSSLLVVATFLPLSNCAQIQVDVKNPCRGEFNFTVFDISKALPYPVSILGGVYTFDPCSGLQCQTSQPGLVSVCQLADHYYGCGQFGSPIWTFNGWLEDHAWNWTIVYPNGFEWRLSSITFVEDPNQPETTIEFLGEEPYLQYNFLVTGACIGQPNAPQCGTPAFDEEQLMWWEEKFAGRLSA